MQCGFSGEVFVSTRRMPQEVRQGLDVSCLCDEATFEISLKHHADIERRPRWSSLSHLLLERIHILTRVTNLFAEQFAPNRCRFRTTQSFRTVKVTSLAVVFDLARGSEKSQFLPGHFYIDGRGATFHCDRLCTTTTGQPGAVLMAFADTPLIGPLIAELVIEQEQQFALSGSN